MCVSDLHVLCVCVLLEERTSLRSLHSCSKKLWHRNTVGRDDESQHGANEGHSCRPRSSPGGDKVSEPQHASPPYCQGNRQQESGPRWQRRGREGVETGTHRERKDEEKWLKGMKTEGFWGGFFSHSRGDDKIKGYGKLFP